MIVSASELPVPEILALPVNTSLVAVADMTVLTADVIVVLLCASKAANVDVAPPVNATFVKAGASNVMILPVLV